MPKTLGQRIDDAVSALAGTEYCQVIGNCKRGLSDEPGLSREERRLLGAAFGSIESRLQSPSGRVVDLRQLITDVSCKVLDKALMLKFRLCGMIESEAIHQKRLAEAVV